MNTITSHCKNCKMIFLINQFIVSCNGVFNYAIRRYKQNLTKIYFLYFNDALHLNSIWYNH